MLNRVHFHMLTTTNSLESMHEHMNHRTPLNNTFYAALFRIYNELTAKYVNIEDRITYSYYYIKNKSIRKIYKTKNDDLLSMYFHYKTTI